MSRLGGNVRSLLAGEVARRALGFLSVAYLARTTGVEAFGLIMIGLTALSYVVLAGSPGVHLLGMRDAARGSTRYTAGDLVGLRLVCTASAFLVLAAVVIGAFDDRRVIDVVLITSASAFLHASFLDWHFQGRERMGLNAAARVLGAAVYLAVLAAAVHSDADIRWAAAAAVAGDVATSAFLLVRYRAESGPLAVRWRPAVWREVLRDALPFGAGSVLGQLTVNLPVIAAGVILGATGAGLFSGASKLVFFLLMIDRVLGTVLLPASVRLHSMDSAALQTAMAAAVRWIVVVGLPLCVGGTFLGTDIVVLVYGPAFAASGPLLGVLVWFVLLTMLHTVYTSGVIAAGGERDYRNVMATGAAVSVVTVCGGLALFGVFGGAAGVVLAEAVSLVLMARAMHRRLPAVRPVRLGRTVLAVLALTAALALAPRAHVLVTVGAGAVLYLLASLSFKAVSWNDIQDLVKRFS